MFKGNKYRNSKLTRLINTVYLSIKISLSNMLTVTFKLLSREIRKYSNNLQKV